MSANIVSVDEESLRKDIKNLVRKTVEETLNALLDEEASGLVGTGRYERAAGREAHRGGHYARKLVTGAGEVESSARGCSARSRKCSPGDPLPALHGASLPQRAERGSVTRRKAVARMLKAIHARGMRQEGRGGGGRVGVGTARSGREDGARRARRDTYLHGIPAGALAPNQDEQRDRAHQPRDQEEDEGHRNLPGRQLGPHAGVSEAEVHGGARMGQEEVPGHVQTGRDGRAEGKSGGLEGDGAEDG